VWVKIRRLRQAVTRSCNTQKRLRSDCSSTLQERQPPAVKLVQTTDNRYGEAMKRNSVSGFGTGTGLPGDEDQDTDQDSGSRVTVRAIAAETGLSIATVSRVLNGGENVAPETRDRVRQVVRRLGDRAPEPRKRPQLPVTRLPVFVRCPYLLTDYFGHIVTSIAETLSLHGQGMLLDAGDTVRSNALRDLPQRRDTRGAVLILPPEPRADLETLAARSYPFVVVDPRIAVPRGTVSVSAAHFSGARAVTRHLVKLGHRRIGVITGPTFWHTRDDRVGGHLAALSEAGVLGEPELMRHGEPATKTGVRAGGELLDLEQRPTAVVCFNDKVAVGVLEAAHERGLRVPADLSVTGFDDIDVSRAATPRLTTVRQPLQEMGRTAVTMLMRQLEGHAHEALSMELATRLIVRESTGPVPT
jgi:LacI family transcriptional regulator